VGARYRTIRVPAAAGITSRPRIGSLVDKKARKNCGWQSKDKVPLTYPDRFSFPIILRLLRRKKFEELHPVKVVQGDV